MFVNRHNNDKGFTLVELLLALMITGIILAAVATLAFALGSVKDSTDDTSYKEAQIRYSTLRLTDLIRHCKLICGAQGTDVAIWKADDNGDGKINAAELVYIESGQNRNYIQLLEFTTTGGSSISLSDIQSGLTKQTLLASGNYRRTLPVKECSNVQFQFDSSPPLSKFVSISFNITENNASRQCQINALLRGWAGNLLNKTSSAIVGDDD
jgi:prepilin-type N-terminal cleavage/methylation domain-containing protein